MLGCEGALRHFADYLKFQRQLLYPYSNNTNICNNILLFDVRWSLTLFKFPVEPAILDSGYLHIIVAK